MSEQAYKVDPNNPNDNDLIVTHQGVWEFDPARGWVLQEGGWIPLALGVEMCAKAGAQGELEFWEQRIRAAGPQ